MIAVENADRDTRDRVILPLLPLCRAASAPLQRLVFPPAAAQPAVARAEGRGPAHGRAGAPTPRPDEDDPFAPADDALCREAARRAARPRAGAFAARRRAGRRRRRRAAPSSSPPASSSRRSRAARSHAPARLDRAADRGARRRRARRLQGRRRRGRGLRPAPVRDADGPPRGALADAARGLGGDGPAQPTTFVAASELASFGERVLDDIDRRLKVVTGFDLGQGREAGAAAGRAVHVATMEIAAFEESIELSRQGPWGQRLMAQKRQPGRARWRTSSSSSTTPWPRRFRCRPAGARGPRGHPRLSHDPDRSRARPRPRPWPPSRPRSGPPPPSPASARCAPRRPRRVEARLSQYVEDLIEVIHLQAPEAGRARLLPRRRRRAARPARRAPRPPRSSAGAPPRPDLAPYLAPGPAWAKRPRMIGLVDLAAALSALAVGAGAAPRGARSAARGGAGEPRARRLSPPAGGDRRAGRAGPARPGRSFAPRAPRRAGGCSPRRTSRRRPIAGRRAPASWPPWRSRRPWPPSPST